MFEKLRQNSLRSVRDELIALVEAVSPSVVTVRKHDTRLEESSGSGWVFGPGLVVTNCHVVAGADPVFTLRLRGGALVPATLVGSDPLTDLALLRADIQVSPLQVATKAAQLGELCFAFGSPLGMYPETVTFGVVSGLGRSIPHEDGRSIEGALQIDAEINPGNSGGPLVDIDGAVLGVNTMIRTDGRGVGFAISSSTIQSVIPELIAHGQILRPRLGISIDVVEHNSSGIERERLRVAEVGASSPFQVGDLLVSIAGRTIETRGDLFEVLRRPLIGAITPATVERSGELVAIELELSDH